jgi:SagB-type dehydrogenase family enzyme
MKLNFGKIFQRESQDKSMGGTLIVPPDSTLWPEDWKKIFFKEYTRFPKIKLPEANIEGEFSSFIKKRTSLREWGEKSLSLQEVSNILAYSCGITKKTLDVNYSRRVQASAGARFPIEVYIINKNKGELDRRVYHYNVQEHSLDVLWKVDDFGEGVTESMYSNSWSNEAPMSIVITGVTSRIFPKYGERGYRYMYLEAGAVAHMINVVASAQDLSCVIVGDTNDNIIESILDIDGDNETVITSILIGNLKK